ncbi:MAG: hypothetical protein ACYC6A_10070 [Armatimonadota bacterium]
MQRFILVCALLAACLGAAFAQGPVVVAPQPLRGIVTVTAPYGQFYTNLGARERLCAGAEILLVRGGVAIARARILKVNQLDSIAQLAPEFPAVIPQTGDVAVVQVNPQRPTVGRLTPPDYWGTVPRNCRPPELPAIEPDMDFRDLELTYTLAAIAILVDVVTD